jgi:hypothetical protein
VAAPVSRLGGQAGRRLACVQAGGAGRVQSSVRVCPEGHLQLVCNITTNPFLCSDDNHLDRIPVQSPFCSFTRLQLVQRTLERMRCMQSTICAGRHLTGT